MGPDLRNMISDSCCQLAALSCNALSGNVIDKPFSCVGDRGDAFSGRIWSNNANVKQIVSLAKFLIMRFLVRRKIKVQYPVSSGT